MESIQKYALVPLLFCLYLSLQGQIADFVPKKRERIPFIGVNFSLLKTGLQNDEEVRGSATLRREFTLGFQGGITLGYRFSKRFSVLLEPRITSEGQRYFGKFKNLQNTIQNFTYEVRLTGFRIPIAVRYYFIDRDTTTSWFFQIGPQLLWILNAAHIFMNDPLNYEEAGIKPKEVYQTLSYGAHLGIGVNTFINENFAFSVAPYVGMIFTDIEKKNAKWKNPVTLQEENYYENFYTHIINDQPIGSALKQATLVPHNDRVEPTTVFNIGINVGLHYYFIY